MTRTSPLLILAILLSPFTILWATGNLKVRFPGAFSTTTAQMLYFDPSSSFKTTTGYNCEPGWFATGVSWSKPSNYPCKESLTSSTSSIGGIAGGTFSKQIATLGSDSNDQPGPNCNIPIIGSCNPTANCASTGFLGTITACAHASILLDSGGYALTGTIVGTPQLIGQPGTTFNFETSPPATNPIVIGQQYSNTTATYKTNIYVYRFGIDVRLAIAGDKPVVTLTCQPSGQTPDPCPAAMQSALSQAVSFTSTNNLASGQIVLDLNIPTSFTATPYDRYGFGGAWIANQQCLISSTQVGSGPAGGGGIADFGAQCLAHAAVKTNVPNYAYNDFSTLASQATNLQQLQALSIGQLPSSLQLFFTLNKMGPVYTSSISADGKTATLNYASGGTVDIPIIFDIWATYTQPLPPTSPTGTCIYGGTPPNCNPAPIPGTNIKNLTQTGPGYATTLGSILVHVTDAFTTFPLAGMSVSINSGGSCSTNYASSTNAGGNFNFTNLSTSGGGAYTICASGGTGTLTLFIVSFGVTYSGTQAQAVALPGQTVIVNLPLQPNAYGVLTITSIILFGMGLIALVAIIVIAPASLGTVAGGLARGVRSSRGRR